MGRWTETRSRIGVELKRDPDADVSGLRQQLKAERLEDRIRQDISSLSSQQQVGVAAVSLEELDASVLTPEAVRRLLALLVRSASDAEGECA